MQYPDIDDDSSWFSRYRCRGRTISRPTETFDVSFGSSKHLTINQERFEDDTHHFDTYVSIQGEVVVRRSSPKDKTPHPSVVVEVTANDDRILSKIETQWNPSDQSLTIKTPDGINTGQRNLQLCATVKATVWVPEDAELNYLQIATIHLGVQLLDNLSLTVKTLARFDAVAGDIISASAAGKKSASQKTTWKEKNPPSDTSPSTYAFHPRRVEGCTTSGHISGVWPLFDSLILKSTSGNIKIGVEPHDAWDEDSKENAELAIRSTSGDVDFHTHGITSNDDSSSRNQGVNVGEEGVPNRNYVLDVHTTSGNVHGLAAFGPTGGATVKSTSGTLKLGLLPVLQSADDTKPVEVSTSSTSGTTYVTILDPVYFSSSSLSSSISVSSSSSSSSPHLTPTSSHSSFNSLTSPSLSPPPLRNIHDQHTSTSGDFHLYLPLSWEGEIVMTSLSGKLGVSGKDVKLIKSGEKWPGFNKELVARKGDVGGGGDKGEGSRVRVGLTSGSGEVRVG